MADRLPVRAYNFDAAALAERQQIPIKFDQYTNPGKYGISWGPRDEAAKFLAAAERGFIPLSAEGLETMFYWQGIGTIKALEQKQFEWVAFSAHFNGVPFNIIAEGAPLYPVQYGAALVAEYGLPLPPPRPAPATPPPPVREFHEFVDFVVTKSAPSPFRPGLPAASGDGKHFPVVAWRILTRATGGGAPAEDSYSPWVRYGDLVVNNISSETTIVEFIEDLTPAEVVAVLAATPGGPPPLATVDVIAAPSSTSFRPVTIPAGQATPNVGKPDIPAPLPSGSIPIPDTVGSVPGVQPWVDAEAPSVPVGGATGNQNQPTEPLDMGSPASTVAPLAIGTVLAILAVVVGLWLVMRKAG